MTARIAISWPGGRLEAELFDTPTTQAVLDALPATATAGIWGEEVRFGLASGVRLEEAATQVVDPGTVCYWVEGASLALPFGRTPISRGYECCLVTAVNILGRIDGDYRKLAAVREGELITLERLA